LGLDDLMSTESAVVAAATAAVFSPRTRETLRRGAVLGVTGAFKVGDVVAGAARGATRGIRGDEQAPTSAGRTNGGTGTAPATAKPRRSNASSRPSRAARPTRATSS
jgi:hypothetical protein